MFRYLCPAAISKTHSCPHFLMKPQKILPLFFLGFVLATYTSIPAIAIAVIALAAGVYTFIMLPNNKSNTATGKDATVNDTNEEDFFA